MALTTKAMNSFLIASALSMCATAINTSVDGIIVGRFVSPEALSAVNLYSPYAMALSVILLLLAFSATGQAAYFIGERNREQTGKFISTSLLSLFVTGLLLSAYAFLFTDSYVSLVCYDNTVAPYLHTYFRIVGSGTILFLLAQFACEVVSIDGRPSLGTRAVVISVLCNIVLDILLTAILGLGIAGSATATLIAYAVTVIILSGSHIFTKNCSFTISLLRNFSVSALKSILKLGGNMSVTSVFATVFIYVANFIIQKHCGTDGLFTLSIGLIIFNICVDLSIGVGRSVTNVGGFLKGQRDWSGFRYIVNRSVRVTLLIGFAVAFSLMFGSRLLVQVFGADTPEMVDYCTKALRIFIWIVPSSMFVALMMFIYQAMMNTTLISVPTISFSVVEIVFLLAWPYLMPSETLQLSSGQALWYAFPLASLLSVGIIYLISEIVRQGDSTVSRLTHIPKHTPDEETEQLQLSIPTNMDDTATALDSIRTFLRPGSGQVLDRQNISDRLGKKLVLYMTKDIHLSSYSTSTARTEKP